MAPVATSVASPAATDVLRILLVDDNASILRFLASAFTSNECRVSTAAAAEQALSLLTDDPFDLVVSDIKMPGLSGLDLLRAVKAKQPGTPVVLITGVPSVDSAVFGLRHGAYDYLPKPFSVAEVKKLVQRLRADRHLGNGRVNLPAGLAEELARRQAGVEALFRIGELGLAGLEPGAFMATVLDYTVRSLRSDGAVMLLRDEEGRFRVSQSGSDALVGQLVKLLHASFDRLVATGGRTTLALTPEPPALAGLAALIPGTGNAMGVLCLGREARSGAFLPDEAELLLGYGQTAAVALQKMLLRENVEQNLIATISSFVNALEGKDPYLKGHSARVSLYAGEIATAMGMSPTGVEVISRAGMLHDLGKLVTLDHILRKPRRLTPEEYELVKNHTVAGDKILKPLRFLGQEAKAARNHHERYDGKGYPDGLKGEDIPLIARVVTVADAFDAMTSDRPYRSARTFDLAMQEILRGISTQFDPVVAQAFATIPLARLQEISGCWALSAGADPGPATAEGLERLIGVQ